MSYLSAVRTCEIHTRKEQTVYCYDCKKFICFDCSREEHSSHKCDAVANVARETRVRIPQICRTIRSQLPLMEDRLRKMKDVRKLSQDSIQYRISLLQTTQRTTIKAVETFFARKIQKTLNLQQKSVDMSLDKTTEKMYMDILKRVDGMEEYQTTLGDFDIIETNDELQSLVDGFPPSGTDILVPIYTTKGAEEKELSEEIENTMGLILKEESTTASIDICCTYRRPIRPYPDSPISDFHKSALVRNTHGVYDRMLVLGIDIGYTSSLLGFSFTHDWSDINIWKYSTRSRPLSNLELSSLRSPCHLLLDSSKNVVAFGWDADEQYRALREDNEHNDYYYFTEIKSTFSQGDCSEIKDVGGKSMSALFLWTKLITCLKNDIWLGLSNAGIQDRDVEYVFPIPAYWTNDSKEKIKEATVKSGIPRDQLTILLEPEAAALYLDEFSANIDIHSNKEKGPLPYGESVIVADLGRKYANFYCLRKVGDGTYREILPPTGVLCGTEHVIQAFEDWGKSLIREDVWTNIKEEDPTDHYRMILDFEELIYTADVTRPQMCTFLTSSVLMEEIKQSSLHSEMKVFLNKRKIKTSMFYSLFVRKQSENIIEHLSKLIHEQSMNETKAIFLVGCFSKCQFIRRDIMEKFSDMKIVYSDGGHVDDWTILKGSIYYRHLYRNVTDSDN